MFFRPEANQLISRGLSFYKDIALIKSSYAGRSIPINLTPLRPLIAGTKIGFHRLLYDRQ